MKKQLIPFLLILQLLSACKHKDVSFTYSPSTPRAGERVIFSNQTEEGEEWSWNFGDGTTSTSKSPVKTYKKPGTYTVILKVDDNNRFTYTTTITVIDSVPSIGVGDSIVYYYKPFTLSAESYNPFQHKVHCQWHLPDSLVLVSGTTTDEKITVYSLHANRTIHVSCDYTTGDQQMVLEKDIQVHDTIAPALIYATGEGLYQQRIFDLGIEKPIAYAISSNLLTRPTTLQATNDALYIFNDDITTQGALVQYDLKNHTATPVLTNAVESEKQGFVCGQQSAGVLHWSTREAVWHSPAQVTGLSWDASDPQKRVKTAEELGLSASQNVAGLVYYNGAYLWAYGQGITHFNSTGVLATILSDRTLSRFALDPIAKKIYFTDKVGLSVCNFDGQYIQLIDEKADGKSIAIDQSNNLLYWTTPNGVRSRPLVQTIGNQLSDTTKRQINNLSTIQSITIDEVRR